MEKKEKTKRQAYRLEEAAEVIGVSGRHLRKFIQKGQLKSFHLGRSLRISVNALDDFVRALENNPKEEVGD